MIPLSKWLDRALLPVQKGSYLSSRTVIFSRSLDKRHKLHLSLAFKGCLSQRGLSNPPPPRGGVVWRGREVGGWGSSGSQAWRSLFFLVEMKGWVYGTSPELWGKCRECQSKAELRAGKEALDGGGAGSALCSLPSPHFTQLCLTFRQPQGAPAAPYLS